MQSGSGTAGQARTQGAGPLRPPDWLTLIHQRLCPVRLRARSAGTWPAGAGSPGTVTYGPNLQVWCGFPPHQDRLRVQQMPIRGGTSPLILDRSREQVSDVIKRPPPALLAVPLGPAHNHLREQGQERA